MTDRDAEQAELRELQEQQAVAEAPDADTTDFQLAEPFAPHGLVEPAEVERLQRIEELKDDLDES